MRVAVFDLDGTLADTSADLIAAANAALAEAGVGAELDPLRHRATAFAGGRAMLRAGLGAAPDEALVERLFPRLVAFYGAALAVHTQLYDGVGPALDRLAAGGWTLAVCTNKPERLAALLLAELGLASRFAAMVGADTLAWRKPDPRHVTETIRRAGGTPARAAGIPCVLVRFGPEGEGVAALAPEALLGHFDALPELLDRLVPPG